MKLPLVFYMRLCVCGCLLFFLFAFVCNASLEGYSS
ncbi:myosin heavy chain kinase A, putative, partial [Trypanosoma cruzi marinkellei]